VQKRKIQSAIESEHRELTPGASVKLSPACMKEPTFSDKYTVSLVQGKKHIEVSQHSRIKYTYQRDLG
jgi:hypothetical protein